MLSEAKCILCTSRDTQKIIIGVVDVTLCKKCDFQFIENSKKYLEEGHFDNYYAKRKANNIENKNTLRKEQYVIDSNVVNNYIKDGDSILDVGCSSGEFLSIISTLKNDLSCLGIDIDGSGINEANKKYGDIAEYQERNLLTLDGNQQFDLIIFRGTFQYLDNQLHESMKLLKNILKTNGKVLIFSLPSTDAFLYNLLEEKWGLFHPEMSLMFNKKSLHTISNMHNFKIISLSYPYLEDVYANKEKDYDNVKNIILGLSDSSSPFWGSLMTVVISHDN